jgi:hypothetical protein
MDAYQLKNEENGRKEKESKEQKEEPKEEGWKEKEKVLDIPNRS